jgi:hypothetical protein
MQSRLAECLTRAQSSRVSWRKILLLHLWSFVPLWDRYFPSHDLGSGRLKRQSLAGSEAEPDDRDLGEQKTQRGDYWSGPSWREAARQYQAARAGRLLITETEPQRLSWLRELLVNEISLDRAWRELNELSRQAAPQVTLDALALSRDLVLWSGPTPWASGMTLTNTRTVRRVRERTRRVEAGSFAV